MEQWPVVQVELDRTRNLHFDLEAYQDLERAMAGQPLGDVIRNVQSVGLSALKFMLWAGLKHEDSALTPSLTNKMIDRHLKSGKPIGVLINAIADAVDESRIFKTAEEELSGNGQTAGH